MFPQLLEAVTEEVEVHLAATATPDQTVLLGEQHHHSVDRQTLHRELQLLLHTLDQSKPHLQFLLPHHQRQLSLQVLQQSQLAHEQAFLLDRPFFSTLPACTDAIPRFQPPITDPVLTLL